MIDEGCYFISFFFLKGGGDIFYETNMFGVLLILHIRLIGNLKIMVLSLYHVGYTI